MPIIDRRSAAIVSMIIVALAVAVAIPPFIAATGEGSSKTFTQTEGEDLQLTGTLFADLTDVRDGMSFTEVASIHTTDADFNNADTLDNVTVGDDSVSIQSAGGFSDDFDDESADSGVPAFWLSPDEPETVEVSTTESLSGTQSAHLDDTAGTDSGYIHPDSHPLDDPITSDISFAIHATSGSNAGVRVLEGGTNNILLSMRDGDLKHYDGSNWITVSTDADLGEWVEVTITDIDPSTNTFSIEWSEPDSGTGSATGLSMRNGMTSGYDEIHLFVNGGGAYYDDVSIGSGSGTEPQGTYISDTHSVDGAETGFTNLTLTNADAVVTWEADTDGDGSFETEIASDTRTSTGNYTADLSGTSGQNFRVNVTFSTTGEDPTAELHDEGILTTTTEGTDVNVTLIDTETGQTVDTGPINESETRQFVIGGEDVTITNEDVLSGNRSLMTYEYPTYYGMDGGVKTLVSNAPLIALALGFIIVVMALYAGRGV